MNFRVNGTEAILSAPSAVGSSFSAASLSRLNCRLMATIPDMHPSGWSGQPQAVESPSNLFTGKFVYTDRKTPVVARVACRNGPIITYALLCPAIFPGEMLSKQKNDNGGGEMKNDFQFTVQLSLIEGSPGNVSVPAEPFIEFDLDMNRRVNQLVERWGDLAAPAANRRSEFFSDRRL